jgi:FKBP-type peptidyl-prolyl cis-trans isomerase FklB
VTTHYTGTLIDGTVFDSSVERGQPAQFPVNGVIRGWTEALQLMKPGSKLKLYIPSDLAYGDGGSPPKIGPGETLIFEVELISVDK